MTTGAGTGVRATAQASSGDRWGEPPSLVSSAAWPQREPPQHGRSRRHVTARPCATLLIGPYPPPVGGNSVHVQRLFASLRARGYAVRVLDYIGGAKLAAPEGLTVLPAPWLSRLRFLWGLARHTPADTLVHVHVSALGRFRWAAPVLLGLFRDQPKVLTIHSGSFVTRAQDMSQVVLRGLLRPFHAIIAVATDQARWLESIGIESARLAVIPAFLPALPQPELIPDALRAQAGQKVWVVTSGSLTPIYRYQALLECMERVDRSKYLFIFAFYGHVDRTCQEQVCQRLQRYPEAVVLWDAPPEVFLAILGYSDIYVRLTAVDGDSLAVREALSLGKIVLASDCVERPAGCRLFSLDNPERLVQLLLDCEPGGATCPMPSGESNLERILEVYAAARAAAAAGQGLAVQPLKSG